MERRLKKVLQIFIALLLFLPVSAFASNVDDQILQMKKQIEEMQQRVEELQTQLEKTSKDAVTAQERAEAAAQDVEKRVSEVSDRFQVLDSLAKKFSHIGLSGYVRSRFWEGERQHSSFDVTEIALNFRYDVTENISGQFNIWFHPSGNAPNAEPYGRYRNWAGPTTFFESAFAEFRNLNIGPIKGKLIVGKTRNWAFGITPAGPIRITSDYGLFNRSLNISRITGIQYLTNWNKFSANFAVFNGWALSGGTTTRNAGDWDMNWRKSKGVRLLGVGQQNLDDNSNKAFSARFGYQFMDSLNIGSTIFYQRLSSNNLRVFNDIMGRNILGTTSTDKDHLLYGADLTFEEGPFVFKAEFMRGEVSDVTANWWYVLGGYKIPAFKTDLFVRYSQANYDQHRVANMRGSGAWDKEQITPLLIYHIHPKVKLFFEYYFNFENRPSGISSKVKDDYGFIELIVFY